MKALALWVAAIGFFVGGGEAGKDYRLADGRIVHVGSGFGGYFPWVHIDVRIGDTEFKNAGLRYKGNLSFQSSSASAPLFANFKMKLDIHGAKGQWDGEQTFNFSAGVVDRSRIRDAIAYATFRAAGVPAPRTAYAELIFTVPGMYQETSAGLFTMIEDVNTRFLSRVLPPGTGLLMKPEGARGGIQSRGTTWSQFVPIYRPDRDATEHEQRRVMEFAGLVSQTDVALFRSRISTYLDIDEFLRFVAVNTFIGNSDSYIASGHNYYLYHDPSDDRFRFIPWDEDLSMGGRMGMGPNIDMMRPWMGDQPLSYWLFDDPSVNARYRDILKELSTTAFSATELMKLVDSLEKLNLNNGGTSPRGFLENSASNLQRLVASWR